MIRRDHDARSIHPLNLVSPRRLDLVCKYLYFRELRSSSDSLRADASFAGQLYQKHISRRTGGLEPRDPFDKAPNTEQKQSVADYLRLAKVLLSRLTRDGFDPSAAVPYFADGTLGNGAHRVSAALALDIPIFARLLEGHGTAWDFKWFVENGFTTEELQRLLYAYTLLKPDRVALFVFYPPAQKYWESFARIIADALYVVGSVDVSIDSRLGMYEVVHDLYAVLEPLSSTGVINRKALLISMARELTLRVVLAERRHDRTDVYRIATDVKNICRQEARDTVAPDSYLAIHAGASRAETENLARVLLSANNLYQLNRRRSVGVRAEFLRWLGECRDACLRSGIAINDICVVGSSPLEVIGVRPSTDIDFTLKSQYREARYGTGVSHLTPVVDIVTAGYHRSRQRQPITDDELIESPDHHFMFRGIKFANPEIVLEHKDYYRRDKDIADVEKARSFFAETQPTVFDPTFEFASRCETLMRELTEPRSAIAPTKLVAPLRNVGKRMFAYVRSKARGLSRRFRSASLT